MRISHITVALAAAFTLMATTIHAQTTWYVSPYGDNTAGTNWVTAYRQIQTAVTESTDGDTIVVDAGIYDSITTGNKSIVIISYDDTLVTAINGNGMTRCATLGRDGFPNDTNTVLRGFILINGLARDGGGSYGGTLIDCDLINNNATYGGGSYGGVLGGCWLVGNEATQHGGGAYGGILFYSWLDDNTASRAGGGTYESTLYYCELIANKVYHTMSGVDVQGGGAYKGKLYNCFLQNNFAFSSNGNAEGGGAWGSALNNCFVNENSAVSEISTGSACGGGTYGGTLTNCTLVANVSKSNNGRADGGGAYGGTLSRCIVEGNLCGSLNYTARGGGAYGAILNHCVLVDNTAAYGQLSERASDIVVAFGGAEGSSEGHSIGSSEGGAKGKTWSDSVGGSVSVSVGVQVGVFAKTSISGTVTASYEHTWGGSEETNWATTRETNWATTLEENWSVSYPKFYTTVTQSEGLGGGAYGGTLNNCILWNNTAWCGGGAENATLNNCTVVENTSFREGGGTRYGTVNNSIVVFNQSNGTTDTGTPVNPTDYNSYNSTLNYSHVNTEPLFVDRAKQNFRLQLGSPCIGAGNNSYVTWDFDLDGKPRILGSGVNMGAYESELPRIIGDLYVSPYGNDTDGKNWTTAKKTIQAAVNAAVAGETIIVWDGVYAPISVYNKSLTIQSVNGAKATIIDGGKTSRCATLGGDTVLSGFMLINGYSRQGGGVFGGTLNYCILMNNAATSLADFEVSGGGAYACTLNNCTLSGNFAKAEGGGAYYCTLNNCTLTGNTAHIGGGAYGCTLNNCIVWGNTASFSGNASFSNYGDCTFCYSCTWPMPSGSANGGGNTDQDPLFVDALNGDYRLQLGSPCIDTGNNDYVTWEFDLDGKVRIVNGTVDMGTYEFWKNWVGVEDGVPVTVPYSWLDPYLNWKGVTMGYAPRALSQGANGMAFWESYVAGCDPTNAASRFVITNFVMSGSAITAIGWTPNYETVPEPWTGKLRVYEVLGKTNLTDDVWVPTNSATRFFRVKVSMPKQ